MGLVGVSFAEFLRCFDGRYDMIDLYVCFIRYFGLFFGFGLSGMKVCGIFLIRITDGRSVNN